MAEQDTKFVNKISSFWDQRHEPGAAYEETAEKRVRTNWRDIKPVLDYLKVRKSGNEREDFVHYLKRRKYKFKDAISLGCGDGRYESLVYHVGLCENLLGVDCSPKAIGVANEKYARENLRYEVGDIGNPDYLKPNSLDAILMKDSLHHVVDLEEMFERFVRALRPGGAFITEDFFGATRWQWSRDHLDLINRVLDILPESYKKMIGTDPPKYRRILRRHNPVKLAEDDPSESARSGEIYTIMRDYFEIVEEKGRLGSLIFPILPRLSGNFDEDDERDMAMVKLILLLEEVVIDHDVIPPVFRSILARPKR